MSAPRLFYCTVAGLVIATGVSFLYGASGLFNYRQLQAYERQVVAGIAALQERHRTLQTRLQALRDPELVRLLARDTGYFRPDEMVVEVGPAPLDPLAAGGAGRDPDFTGVAPLLQPTPPTPREPFNALALGLFLGVGLFATLTLLRTLRHRKAAGNGRTPTTGYAGRAEPPARPRRRPDRGIVDPSQRPLESTTQPESAVLPESATRLEPAIPPESATAPRPAVRLDVGASPAHGRERSSGAPAAEADGGAGASARRRRQSRRRRRRDVAVYRL